MGTFSNKKMVILEIANNHMGNVEHGIKLIDTFGAICKKFNDIEFVFKLQYRDLDSFVHPSYKGRMDVKFIKRFEETRLTKEQFISLIDAMKRNGFKTMSTPFDNASVSRIIEEKLDYIKIASCSFGDWPLLEEIVKYDIPIVASTAGALLKTIDNVVSFFNHRNKDFALMHVVGEYPTPKEKMILNQIDFMKKRYYDIVIGLSTHEDPDNYELVKMSVAKGVKIYEKHVGLPTDEYQINAYSVSPEQFEKWLESMDEAYTICGPEDSRVLTNENELKTLHELRRGVCAKVDLKACDVLTDENTYFAFPPEQGQLTANDWSKYVSYATKIDLKKDEQIYRDNITISNHREDILDITKKVKSLVKESGITIPNGLELEISHHYGIEKFMEYGISMLTIVNRDYCKKLIIVLGGQTHPEQYHQQKEETFHLLYGDLSLKLDGNQKTYKQGDVILVEPQVRHEFFSKNGAIIEEISSTHFLNDSFYTDERVAKNKNRKTFVSFWMDAE